MTGRGAWNTAGNGGTKQYKDATKPGPYYYLGTGLKPTGRARTPNEYAVYRAVVAYQDALNVRLQETLAKDGYFGPVTSAAVTKFQQANEAHTGTPWGGIGPDTSKALLLPDVKSTLGYGGNNSLITVNVISGTINHESMWDAGAVGYTDDRDLGLAQINGAAHPNLSVDDRFTPIQAYKFIISYYNNALSKLNNNLRDAIASYNLGIGGAQRWISEGRPDFYTPQGETVSRNIKAYIDSALAG